MLVLIGHEDIGLIALHALCAQCMGHEHVALHAVCSGYIHSSKLGSY